MPLQRITLTAGWVRSLHCRTAFLRMATAGCLVVAFAGGCSEGRRLGGTPGDGGAPSRGGGPPTAIGSGGSAGAAVGPSGAAGMGPVGGGGGVGQAGASGTGGTGGACSVLPPIPRRVLALSPSQFGNAARDLLGLPAAPQVVGVTRNFPGADGAQLFVDSSYLYALYVAAGTVVTQVVPRAAALAACMTSETDADCAARFARSFGRKAFRRALDDVEVTDIMKVFATVCPGPSTSCASPTDFAAAIGLMMKAFILAPSFLYRTELGPRDLTPNAAGVYPDTTLTPDEVATQLAFMLLGSTPDADLLAAADSGALATPAGILAQVNRLLAVPAAQANLDDQVSRWLGMNALPEKVKDASLLSRLPAPDQSDQAALENELRGSWDRSLAETLWSTPSGKVTDLLTSQTFFADWRLATLYGLPPGATTDEVFNETAWPAVQPRAGILTHPAFLWALSDPLLASVVQRGKFIHDQIVCQDPLPGPIDLSTVEAQAVIAMGDSEATKSDARLASGKLCADTCHSEIDPYGRLLHAFDAIGNFRTADEAGRPIDTTETLTANSPLGATTISGPVAFAQALVSTKVFAGCAVQRMLETAVALPVNTRNTCQVNELRAAFDGTDGSMASLMRVLVTADFARARAGGTP